MPITIQNVTGNNQFSDVAGNLIQHGNTFYNGSSLLSYVNTGLTPGMYYVLCRSVGYYLTSLLESPTTTYSGTQDNTVMSYFKGKVLVSDLGKWRLIRRRLDKVAPAAGQPPKACISPPTGNSSGQTIPVSAPTQANPIPSKLQKDGDQSPTDAMAEISRHRHCFACF